MRLALVRFAMLTLLTLAGVASVTVVWSQHLARDEAVRDARSRTVGIARGIAAPLVNSQVRQGDAEAMLELETALRNRMLDGTGAHIAVWDVDGTVIWTDDPEVVHPGEELPGELTAQGVGESVVVHREDQPLAYAEADSAALVEVYVRTLGADGRPFIFEAYTPRDRLQTDTGALMGELPPLTMGSLLVLVAAIVPLSLSLARRIDRASASRREILRHSLRSWQRERERLAQSLHDDVIQDLSALGYALPAVLDTLPHDSRGGVARAKGDQITEVLIRSVRALRSVLTDLAPAGFEDASLEQALDSLAQQHRERGLAVEVSTDTDLRTGNAAGTLIYRIVREGLQNVTKHADATEARVGVLRRGSVVEVTVDDDGRGPGRPRPANGHVGLQLLEHFLTDVDGSLELVDRPGGGARLRAVVPLELPELDDALRD